MRKAKAQPLDREELARRLYELGREELKLEALEMEMNQDIDRVKKRFAGRLETRRTVIEQLARDLRVACEDSRADLLPKGRKSVETIFGKVGWRKQGDRVSAQKGVSMDAAAKILQLRGFDDLVRRRLEPDKPAIKAAMDAGTIEETDLREAGLRLVRAGEDWWYEVDRQSVADRIGEEAA